MLNKSSRVWAPWFGMGCKAQTTAIAQLWRGFATLQTAQDRADRATRDLFSVALGLYVRPGARERLKQAARERFLSTEWPPLRVRLRRLGLGARDLNWE